MPESKVARKGAARFAGTAELRGTTIRGPILKPGTFEPHVDGKPLKITFPKDVILDAYKRLKKRVDAGLVEIRLTHPDLQGLPIRFGLAKEVRVDPEKGEVWLSDGAAYPEMERLLTDKARDTLQTLALSMVGPMEIEGSDEEGWTATRLDVESIDIVDEGAFGGAWIVPAVPAGLAARKATTVPSSLHEALVSAALPGRLVEFVEAAAAHVKASQSKPPGDRGGLTDTRTQKGVNGQMPKIEDASMVPDDVRDQLGNDADKIAAYIAAYNAAIEDGMTPLEAHEAALAKATEAPEAAAEAEGDGDEKKEKKKEKEGDAKAKTKKADAAAAAAAKDAATLRKRIANLEAELATRDDKKRTLEARVVDLEATSARLEAEKALAEAEKDVEDAIVRARKAAPAERKALLAVRAKVGRESFKAMIDARASVAIPVGELGHAPEGPHPRDPVVSAAALIQKYGIDGVFQAGIVQVDAGVRALLASEHPTHPMVRKHCAKEIAAVAAHGARNGKGGGT